MQTYSVRIPTSKYTFICATVLIQFLEQRSMGYRRAEPAMSR
jgi:hypothetical protein